MKNAPQMDWFMAWAHILTDQPGVVKYETEETGTKGSGHLLSAADKNTPTNTTRQTKP